MKLGGYNERRRTLIKILLTALIFFNSFFFATLSHALPFSIVPNGNLPISVPLDGTVIASYIVTNNTGQQRNNNYVQYLPPTVSVTSSGCTSNFSLAPSGQPGSSCILNLLVVAPVNGSDPDPTHHLFVCFPGGKTCAGTNYPLNVTQGPPDIVSMTIAPTSASIAAGFTQQYTATGTYSDGSIHNVTNYVNWNSDTPAVSTINSSGLATGLTVGTANITASFGTVTSNSSPLTVTAPILQSIAITPTNNNIIVNGTLQYTATGTYSDGSTQPLSSVASWNSSNTVAVMMNSSGLATGEAVGSANITATYSSITSNTATLLVTQFAYVANSNTNNVSYCILNSNGTFGTCNTTGSGFATPQGLAFNTTANLTYTVYVVNNTGNSVSYCSINSDGSFGTCNSTTGGGGAVFNSPSGITIDPAGSYVYISNGAGNNVISCQISNVDGSLNVCNDTTGTGFTTPAGIAIDSNNYAYVADNGANDNVETCPISSPGTFGTCVDSGAGSSPFSNPTGIALNTTSSFAYIANNNSNTTSYLTFCIFSSGVFSSCGATGSNIFITPNSLWLVPGSSQAYVTDSSANLTYLCTINSDGTITTCNATGGGFSGPYGVYVP